MSFPEIPRDPRTGEPALPPHQLRGGLNPSGPPTAPPVAPPAVPTPPQAPTPSPFGGADVVAAPGLAAGVGDTSFIGGDFGSQTSSTVEKKPSIVGRLGLVAAAVAIAGGGAFAVANALSDPTGPSSPDEAVEQFFDSLDNDDLLGMTEAMLPSERESLVEPSLDLLTQLQRLELVDPAMNPEAPSSLDFTVTDLQFVATEIGEGVARVRLLEGVVTVSGSTDDLPVGSLIEEEMGEPIPSERIDEQIVDFDDEEGAMLVAVEEDGSWYLSLWYTVAEYAREEARAPIPDFGNGVAPIGAATPEGAVEGLIREAADLDAAGVIAMLDPAEFRALYDYAPLFLDDAEAAVDELLSEARSEGVDWNIESIDARSFEQRGRTVVAVDGFAAWVEGEGERYSIDFDDECVAITGPDADERFCQGDVQEEFGAEFDSLTELFDIDGGVTVVERDGRWYVSGMPSIVGVYADLLAGLDRADLDRIERDLEALAEGGFGLFDEFAGGGAMFFGDPFEPVDPFVEDDPFAEDDPFIEPELAPEVAPEDAALFPEDFDLFANDPGFWFGFDSQLVPLGYTSAWTPDFDLVDVARFAPGSGPQLLADLEADERYELIDVSGLPDGAVAYEYSEVDVMVVYRDFVVSTWLDDDIDHVVAQVTFLAEN